MKILTGRNGLASETLSDAEFRPYLEMLSELNIEDAIAKLDRYDKGKNPHGELWHRWLRAVNDAAWLLLCTEPCTGSDYNLTKLIRSTPRELTFAVPVYLASKIFGIGFALACDALKDLGWQQFAKPDVHVNAIFLELGLAQDSTNSSNRQINVFQSLQDLVYAVNEGSNSKKLTPFALDKILWLCCSGNFYKHEKKLPNRRKLRESLIRQLRKNIPALA